MNWLPMAQTLFYSVFGLVILCLGFYVVDKLTPGDMWDEIIQKHNVALAVLAAGFAIALGLIIASAIH
jgi:putative membrane protein